MHGVANFIEGLVLWYDQFATLIFGIFLKEWFHLPCTVQEVAGPIILPRLEVLDFLCFDVEIVDYFRHRIFQHLYGMCIVNVVEHSVAVHPELFDGLGCYLRHQILHVDGFVEVNALPVHAFLPPRERLALPNPLLTVGNVV